MFISISIVFIFLPYSWIDLNFNNNKIFCLIQNKKKACKRYCKRHRKRHWNRHCKRYRIWSQNPTSFMISLTTTFTISLTITLPMSFLMSFPMSFPTSEFSIGFTSYNDELFEKSSQILLRIQNNFFAEYFSWL